MEANLAICRCGADMHLVGAELICPWCGYTRDAPYKKVLTQAELLVENAKLKEDLEYSQELFELHKTDQQEIEQLKKDVEFYKEQWMQSCQSN